MRTMLIAAALLIVTGCTTTQEIRRPDGSVEHLIACGASLGWNICYDKANQICPSGYTTLSADAGFNRKELRISCSAAGKVEPRAGQEQQQQQQTVVVQGLGSGTPSLQKGSVAVVADQEDAEVHVDGIFSGNCPANLRLSEGIHIIEVKKPGFQNYRRELRVAADSELTLRVQLKQANTVPNKPDARDGL
jgi:hypothetical protein